MITYKILVPFTLQRISNSKINDFVVVGIWAYLTSVDRPTTIDELKQFSPYDYSSIVSSSLLILVNAGLVEEIFETKPIEGDWQRLETEYEALLPNKSGDLNQKDIDTLVNISWLAKGIYQHLLLHGSHSIMQLGIKSPTAPFAEISKAIDELIELGLVREVVEAETVKEGAT